MTDETSAAFVDSIARLARQGHERFDHPQGGVAIMRPDGVLEHLRPIDMPLTHVKQVVAFHDAGSLIHYVNRFKHDGVKTTIFADYTAPKIVAIIDYHDGGVPDYLHHRAEFVPPWSEQWARWRAIDGKPMSQTDFAEFIEENMVDVVAPEGAVFLDLVTGLMAKKKVSFESGIRLQDGSNQLTYAEDIEARGKGNMVVPSDFSIGLPVFFGGDSYRVRCLLRYRINDGTLTFIIKINRRLFIEQTAFAEMSEAIAKGTGLTVLAGKI